jgi:translation initiation factor IF-1
LSVGNHYHYSPSMRKGYQKESNLSRDDHVQLDGVVTNVFAGGQFEVKTDAGPVVRAQLSGRMRKNRIRVILGDRVTVALSPYDLTHGMITYRLK